MPDLDRVLENIRVVELASVLAGPSAGQFLAEQGASVIKVENAKTGGDVTRTWTMAGERDADQTGGRTAYFSCCNWGKRSIAADLRHPDGRAIVHALIQKSDVVIDSYKPGAAENLGVDATTLRGLNDHLVHVSLNGYGADDPRPGYDAAIQAESGFMMMNGQSDGPPTKMPVALIDLLAAHHIKEAVLLGLLKRTSTGSGCHVSISLMDAALSSMANQASGFLQAGILPTRMGSGHPSIVPYGTPFRTRDGKWLTLAVGSDNQFQKLANVLGMANTLGSDDRFRTNTSRVEHRREVESLIDGAVRERELVGLVDELHAAGVPCSKVGSVADSLTDPSRESLMLRSGDGVERVAAMRQSLGVGMNGAELLPPPRFGEHTVAILEEELGFSEEKVGALLECGAVMEFSN